MSLRQPIRKEPPLNVEPQSRFSVHVSLATNQSEASFFSLMTK